MGLFAWFEGKIRNFTIWDFAVLKIALILFGIIIGAYIAAFVQQYVLYFVVSFLVLYAIILYRMLKK